MPDQPEEQVTIYAARMDRHGDIRVQLFEGGAWWSSIPLDPTDPQFDFDDQAAMDDAFGPTRPVRIATTDPVRPLDSFDVPGELHLDGGLSADQHIRDRAAKLLIADHTAGQVLGWKLGDWCRWIRDGRTPGEAASPGFADPGGPWLPPEDTQPAPRDGGIVTRTPSLDAGCVLDPWQQATGTQPAPEEKPHGTTR